MRLVMDDRGGSQGPPSHRRRSAMRVSTKSKAPSPPILMSLESPDFSQKYPGYPHLTMDQKENQEDVSLVVVLPGGAEKTTTVPCSKPMMDLLVMLCAKYHLNPSSHTLELVTTNRNHIKFKPNALIGTLEAEKVLLKPKGMEDKNKKTSPQMPEATVRMVINYRKTQKTILRVNPRVPLSEHLPAIAEKCEFDERTTVLMRDVQSQGPLDLSNSLNDYAIREVYARDTKDQPPSPTCPSSPTLSDTVTPGKDKTQKEKENKGLFSMFRRSKKSSEQGTTASAPASPVLVSKPRPLSMALPSTNSSAAFTSTTTDAPKKRRAPQPPILVSQSCPSDLSTRQRLRSEPEAQSDDQKSGISRGSSAESSLKRTKRKAPPPPVVVQDKPVNGSSQESSANNTLEEIVEQEESTASMVSGTVSDELQGDDSSINLSADVSMDQDAEKLILPPTEVTQEDHSSDLSSDGKSMESTANDSVAHNNPRLSADMDLSEPAESAESVPCQVEDVSQACEEQSPAELANGECSSVCCDTLSPPAQSATQGEEAQASVQPNTETPQEETNGFESPAVANGVPRPHAEDAQVQTDFPPPLLHEPPQPDAEQAPSSAPQQPASSGSVVGQKKDMATFTEDLNLPDPSTALSPTPDTSECQESTPSPLAAATKAPSMHAQDSEPKPKPSNELTRDYIPKVGMTTYTIVPQKTLEKLRYYEVELTLESPPLPPPPPPEALEKDLDIDSLHLEDSVALQELPEAPTTPQTPKEDSLLSDTTTISTTTTTSQSTVNGSMTEPPHSPLTPTGIPATDDNNKVSSPTNGGFQAGLTTTEGKEMKIPPATKPKPGSFRLAQHKRTPGYYVTSAAEKRLSPGAEQREAPGSLGRDSLPPPPPPPVQCPEEPVGGAHVELSPKEDDKTNVPLMRLSRQSSLPVKESRVPGLSLEKLRSFAAPRPYSPTTPSRFAQAVSSAVKRTNSLPYAPRSSHQSPVSPTFSAVTGRFPMKESKGSKESDSVEVEEKDNVSTLQGGPEEPSASPVGLLQPAVP